MKLYFKRLNLIQKFLTVFIGICLIFLAGWSLVFSQNPGSDFTLCTAAVNQEACYASSTVTPRLNWTYTSGAFPQQAFWVQVDNNIDFLSLEVNTNWITSSNNFYDIPAGLLTNNTAYYWRIKAKDTNNSESVWTNADTSFTTPDVCVAITGTLISSIFDIQETGGAAINTIMWQGNQPTGTSVKFQIASGNSTSTWTYRGSDGSDTTYYTPIGPGFPVQINLKYHNNHRYFRYKIFLSTDVNHTVSPRVDDVIINWSP